MPPDPRPPALPAWFPAWARELADLYFSGTTCLFVLHGNVHDYVPCPAGNQPGYCGLADFLATQVFGAWALLLHFDLGRGLRVLPGGSPQRLAAMSKHLLPHLGEPNNWPRDPEVVFPWLDRF